jgi:hypothetical protein
VAQSHPSDLLFDQQLFEQLVNDGATFREEAIEGARSLFDFVPANDPVTALPQPPVTGESSFKGLNLIAEKRLHGPQQTAARFRNQ